MRSLKPDKKNISAQSFNEKPILSGHLWSELRVFLAVSKSKSFNHAAEFLNTSHPTVSRQIKRLEDKIGVRLVTITKKGIILTQAGEFLADEISYLDRNIESITKSLKLYHNKDDCIVRINIPSNYDFLMFSKLYNSLNDSMPNIKLYLVSYNYEINNIDDLTDIIITFHEHNYLDYKLLDTAEFVPAYSKLYLSNYGAPRADNLSKHRFIQNTSKFFNIQGLENWRDICANGYIASICDNFYFNEILVKQGIGIGLINKSSLIFDTSLVPVGLDLKTSIKIYVSLTNYGKKRKFISDFYDSI